MPSREVKIQNLDCALGAAYKLYLENGIDKVTKEMIAKESDLSRKSIDRYFPEKTDCVLKVMEWLLNKINLETRELFPESLFADGHTGAELLKMYMEYVKQLFLKEPKLFVLYAEFKLYIYRNCRDYEQQYTLMWNQLGNHRLRCKIYECGKQDGTFPADLDIKKEEEYFTESYFGFLSNLAMSMREHNTEEIEKQIDYRINNTIELYCANDYMVADKLKFSLKSQM
jgi:AcrR family transcriptional regulator